MDSSSASNASSVRSGFSTRQPTMTRLYTLMTNGTHTKGLRAVPYVGSATQLLCVGRSSGQLDPIGSRRAGTDCSRDGGDAVGEPKREGFRPTADRLCVH